MRVLNVAKLSEFVKEDFCVSEWSTVRVEHCAYSVPSRLIGEWVRVRIVEDRIVVRYAGKTELDCDRLRGRNLKRFDYRHMIWSLVRKPGGFARYVYREEMFASVVFRRAYDAIQTPHHGLKGRPRVPAHLGPCRRHHRGRSRSSPCGRQSDNAVKLLSSAATAIEVPELVRQPVDLGAYDALLAKVGT